jgi:hypothetical protein
MSKVKVLGEVYGIAITRPFSKQMYEHNDKIAVIMKENIRKAINKHKQSIVDLNRITRSITGYTYSMMSAREMREEMLNEVDRLENWWLAQEYESLIKQGYCEPLKMYMIGFDKK